MFEYNITFSGSEQNPCQFAQGSQPRLDPAFRCGHGRDATRICGEHFDVGQLQHFQRYAGRFVVNKDNHLGCSKKVDAN